MKNIREVRIEHPEKIREWVEDRGGTPARVTEGENRGELRFDFPDRDHESEIEHISWSKFFQEFNERNLVFTHGKNFPNLEQA